MEGWLSKYDVPKAENGLTQRKYEKEYQLYLQKLREQEGKKGADAVRKGTNKFATDYVFPAAKAAGSFSPVGPVIGLTDAYNAYKEGDNTGAIIGAGMEALPYVAKGTMKGISKVMTDEVKQAFLNNELYKINPLAGKIDPTKAYAPISAKKAENIMNTGLIYRGTKPGEATHYIPKYNKEGMIETFVPKFEKDIYGKAPIQDSELIDVIFSNGKKKQIPVSDIKAGKLDKYKNVTYMYKGQLLPIKSMKYETEDGLISFKNSVLFPDQPTIPYSGTSSPDIKFKVGEVPNYSQFKISNQYLLEANPNQLVKGAYKKYGSEKAGFPFKLDTKPLQSGDWGTPLNAITRGEYSTLGDNSRILKLDPIWGYREVVDPDRLLNQSKGIQGISNVVKTIDKTIDNTVSLIRPLENKSPDFIQERARKFDINPTHTLNTNIPSAAYFLHPTSPTKYSNLNQLMSRNRYPYLYKQPLSHPEWRQKYDDLPEEYFNIADASSTVSPTKRQALLLQQYTHEFSPMLNYDQDILLEAGLKKKELDNINKQIIRGIGKNKLPNIQLQHLTGDILSDNLKASELSIGKEFELNRPLSTSFGEYGITDKNNIIRENAKYNFHINTGDKSRGMFIDAKGMPGAYMSAEKEVLLPPSKFKVRDIKDKDVYLDLLENLPIKENGGTIKNSLQLTNFTKPTKNWLQKYE